MPTFEEKGLAQTNPVHSGTTWHFPCQVIRLWELTVADFLKGPLSLLPYAPLTNVDQADVPKLLNTVIERYRAESTGDLREKLFLATYVLMGLRYDEEWTKLLFKGVDEMEESSTYQGLIRRGARKHEANYPSIGRKEAGSDPARTGLSLGDADRSRSIRADGGFDSHRFFLGRTLRGFSIS